MVNITKGSSSQINWFSKNLCLLAQWIIYSNILKNFNWRIKIPFYEMSMPQQRTQSGNPPKMQPVLNTPQNDSFETTLRICTGSFPPFINKSHPLKFCSVNCFVNGLSPNTEGLRLTRNCPNWLSLQMYVIDISCFPEEITNWRQKGRFHFAPLILQSSRLPVIESLWTNDFRLNFFLDWFYCNRWLMTAW